MSLFEELLEDGHEDNKAIIKSFETKDTLSPQIFELKGKSYVLRDDIRTKLIEKQYTFQTLLMCNLAAPSYL